MKKRRVHHGLVSGKQRSMPRLSFSAGGKRTPFLVFRLISIHFQLTQDHSRTKRTAGFTVTRDLGFMSTLMGRDASFIVMNSKQESRTETLRRTPRNPIRGKRCPVVLVHAATLVPGWDGGISAKTQE
ncbi:hypothetical protein E4U54_008803 [Claviceps lovelessii]|nr:hypothetical protein E4U54_008803 [Claviceps lovelessii]